MFTIKWLTNTNGFEKTRLFEGENIEVFYPLPGCGQAGGLKPTHHDYELSGPALFIDAGPVGEGYMLAHGQVYVMNDHGKTVGNYNLGPAQQ